MSDIFVSLEVLCYPGMGNPRASRHQVFLHFNAILEPCITQVNPIFSFLSLDGRRPPHPNPPIKNVGGLRLMSEWGRGSKISSPLMGEDKGEGEEYNGKKTQQFMEGEAPMKIHKIFGLILVGGGLLLGMNGTSISETVKDDHAVATFAGGCFWCMEGPFDELDGVISTTSGYTGGHTVNPTYEDVSAGGTGHAEAVQVTYDPQKISYRELLAVYWPNTDPRRRRTVLRSRRPVSSRDFLSQ